MAAERLTASRASRLMACPGSANLSLSIPGWTPPVEDPDKFKAKGMGDRIHEFLFEAGHYSSQGVSRIVAIMDDFAVTKKARREELTSNWGEALLYMKDVARRETNSEMDPREQLIEAFMGLHGIPPKLIRFISEALMEAIHRPRVSMEYTESNQYLSSLHDQSAATALSLEEKMSALWLDPRITTTVDVAYIKPSARFLSVSDYKTGSVKVAAIGNDQLKYYLVTKFFLFFLNDGSTPNGGLTKNNLFDDDLVKQEMSLWTFEGNILQPDNFNSSTLRGEDLFEWIREARNTLDKIELGSRELSPGDHCTFCPANPHARAERGYPSCPAKTKSIAEESLDAGNIFDV